MPPIHSKRDLLKRAERERINKVQEETKKDLGAVDCRDASAVEGRTELAEEVDLLALV